MKIPGMLLPYDWLIVLEALEPNEFKKLVLAMVNFHAYGTEPPVFKGNTAFVAQILFQQLRLSRKRSSAGRLGGLASQRKD